MALVLLLWLLRDVVIERVTEVCNSAVGGHVKPKLRVKQIMKGMFTWVPDNTIKIAMKSAMDNAMDNAMNNTIFRVG
jgi:hypothetical protein